jgi:hypothetical protein
MDPRLFDSPVRTPQDDLLEMKIAARELARQIPKKPKPFTIGLYGEWGTGKTSFAQLVRHYLTDAEEGEKAPVLFVEFSAWPFRTSDELWRALVLCLAKALYGATEAAPRASSVSAEEPAGFVDRLARFLRRDAIVFQASVPEPDALASYHDLVARLDRTPVSIGKGPAQGFRLDQEQAVIAAVEVAVAALGNLSPLIAGLRSLLGLEAGPRAVDVLRRESNEATRDRIESVEELRRILRELFEMKAAGRCICIFIDDLDRCMPDVALDLLEAVKIFLADVSCIFLVAADEQLIGRGLQMRFKELARDAGLTPGDELFGRKGQEYFEKIIQLGIPVPLPTPEQSQRLIASQFPRWTPSSDIFLKAIGANPRRLKQYCNLLQYRFEVSGVQSGRQANPDLELLEKLIQLRSWDPDCRCFELLERLIASAGYTTAAADLEHCLGDNSAGTTPVDETAAALWRTARSAPAVRDLLLERPRLSEMEPNRVSILVRLSDLKPDPETVLTTQDKSALRLLRAVEVRDTLRAEQVLLEDLFRLVAVRDFPLPVLDALGHLAESEDWTPQMLALEAALDARATDPPASLGPDASVLFAQAVDDRQGSAGAAASPLRAALVSQEPRLSALLREEVLAFLKIRTGLPEPETLLSRTASAQPSELQKNGILAAWTRDNLPPEIRKAIETGLDLRLQTVRHVLFLRRFAKLDALRHCWPELERLLWSDRQKLLAIERQALAAGPWPQEVEETARRRYPDERLGSFLKLRPLFRDIYPEDHRLYLQAVQATDTKAQVPVAPAAAEFAHVEEIGLEDYENITLRIEAPAGASSVPGNLENYEVTLTGKGQSETGQVLIRWQEVPSFSSPYRSILETTEPDEFGLAFQAEITRDSIAVRRNPEPPLQDLGERLCEWLFESPNVYSLFLQFIQGEAPLRILLDLQQRPELAALPWEALYLRSPRRNFLSLSRRCSLVRYLKPSTRLVPGTLTPPLRLLAMFPQPHDMPPLNSEGEEEILRRSLAPAIERKLVQLEVLRAGESTPSNLKRKLRIFQPHLFHFVGHGLFERNRKEGALVCESDQGKAFLLEASALATFLADEKVLLAVLNACDTGTTAVNDVISSLAGALVNAGIPAVVATLRPVADAAALLFAREFYRAFVDGYPLEAALTEARKILSAERLDWSLYALFAGIENLKFLRFSP